MNQQERFIGKIRELLDGEVMRIFGRVGSERMGHGLRRRSRPVLEARGNRLLRSYRQKRNRHEGQQPEFSHRLSPQDFRGQRGFFHELQYLCISSSERSQPAEDRLTKIGAPPLKGAPTLPLWGVVRRRSLAPVGQCAGLPPDRL